MSIRGLGPNVVAFLGRSARAGDALESIFHVTVVQTSLPRGSGIPDVSGRYQLLEDEIQFFPHFPFERDMTYRFSFDPQPLGALFTVEPFDLEFLIPSEQKARALTEVTHIVPSSGLLPENLLRFYVHFSNSMRRGRALEAISLLDSDGQPVADALYRAPVELWDRTMQRLTVLLDPGRLKRWVGPNVALDPPLKAGHEYTLEIGSGMTDLYGRPLVEHARKHFLVGDSVREPISLEQWRILPPATGNRGPLVLIFPRPLDRALLFQTIRVESEGGLPIKGQVGIDQCETRWSFTPTSTWATGAYRIRIGNSLEDVCGNSITGPFDRPLRKDPDPATEMNGSSLIFQLK